MNITRTWRQFIALDPDSATLNANAEAIADIVASNESNDTEFRRLAEYRTLGLWTRSPDAFEIQQSYFHQVKGLRLNHYQQYIALMGGVPRAQGVRMAVSTIFQRSPGKSLVPSIKALLMDTSP